MTPTGVEDLAMGFGVGGLRGVRNPLPTLYQGAARPFAPEPGAPLGRVRLDKAGSGEGYHGEGYGGYVSEVPEIGKYYQQLYGEYAPDTIEAAKRYLAQNHPRQFGLIEKNSITDPNWVVKRANAMGADFGPGGALYEMRYPNAGEEQFLRWDTPLYEQSDYVKSSLRKLGIDENKKSVPDYPLREPPAEMTGEDIYELLSDKYFPLARFGRDYVGPLAGDPKVAGLLRTQGIRGTRYPVGEQEMSPGKFNYSVFSPEAMQVMRRLAAFLPPGVALGGGLLAEQPPP